MSLIENESIKLQKSQVLCSDFHVDLHAACNIGSGIVKLNKEDELKAINTFDNSGIAPSFFIPSSGSGSRMFQFLFEYLETEEDSDLTNRFFSSIEQLPFYPGIVAKGGDLNDRKAIVNCVLNELGLASLPKGLIPFHTYENGVHTSFQDQVIQASKLLNGEVSLEFTVQEDFEKVIAKNIEETCLSTNSEVKFSHQNRESNAYCFDANGDLVFDGAELLRRPSGHGALLENLNAIESQFVLMKNIDNIQHNSKSELTTETWKIAAGLLLNFTRDLNLLSTNFSLEALIEFNSVYQIIPKDLETDFSQEDLTIMKGRPTRVCGMVKNEGEPGGGPFWITDDGVVSKQIVEKAQIKEEQLALMQESSHFNPVFLVLSKSDSRGNKLDLNDFKDDTKYFVVEKSHKGKLIKYRELPGLWNGSMSRWNTIFLEIPSSVFSPVKTVLDLIKPAHLAS